MGAPNALAVIFETLLGVMTLNQESVARRSEGEFLHDYRVAVRRTRAALSLFAAAMPPAMLRRNRRFFSDLGRRTNAARDFEVLRGKWSDYGASLPAGAAAGVASLGRGLDREIVREYAAIGRWLQSRTYRRSLEIWRADLETLATVAGGESILTLAAPAIDKAASKAFELGEKLGSGTSDAAIHRTRIRLKKLRYALEFSRSLAAGTEIESFIVALKELQDEFGEYQDLVVHEERIAGLVRAEGATPELVQAGDGLVAILSERRERLRTELLGVVAARIVGLRLELEAVLESLGSRD